MAPRRSGRRNAAVYKKDDYIEYQYKGSTVTGKLLTKSRKGIWVVTPSDRRRKNEDIPEKALGKIINAEEAMSNRGPKLKKTSRTASSSSSPTSANSNSSDGSSEEAQVETGKGGKVSPIEDNSSTGGSTGGKRKNNDSNSNSHNDRQASKAKKTRKVVTFSQEANNVATSSKKITRKKPKKTKMTSTRIGTRSTRGSSEPVLLPELPARKKNLFKTKRVKKDENVKVVKMLTGTLYLYRGDRPRAEFVRSK